MMWPQVETVAQTAIGHLLNSLPEGLLITLFAWVALRLLPRQNSGTRFAVWFVALLAVAGLPLSGFHWTHGSISVRPLVTLPDSWGLVLFLAWLLAACVAMVRLSVGLWHLRALRRSCRAIDTADLAPSVRKTIAGFSSSSASNRNSLTGRPLTGRSSTRRSFIGRSVTLATSERVSVPAAIGFFRPMIVLPQWALSELPPHELNIVLLHEFAHLRRWDDWTNLLQKVVCALFFFHPAVWCIESQLSLEREMACDDVVLAETANPRGYAKCLIALLEKSVARRGWAMAQAVVHRAREASLRLARILDSSRPNTRRGWKPAMGLVSVFSLFALMVVPRVPQFVAFAPNTSAVHGVELAALHPSEASIARVIPAVLRTGSVSTLNRARRPGPPVVESRAFQHPAVHAVEHLPAARQVIPARWNTEPRRSPADNVTSAANQTVAPQPEMLFVVRTAQRTGPNSWIWSVYVWQVTLVNPAQESSATHKT